MSFEDLINKHFFSIILVNVLIFVLAIGIFNTKLAYLCGILGTMALCVIDRYEEKIMRMYYDNKNE